MTIVHRKLALLEKTLNQREQEALVSGYAYSECDRELRNKLTTLMDQIRLV